MRCESERPASDKSFVAAYEVRRHERPIDARERMRMQRVHLSKIRAQLAGLEQQVGRQRRERDVAFLHLSTFRADGKKEVRARVRIHNRLERGFNLAQLHR